MLTILLIGNSLLTVVDNLIRLFTGFCKAEGSRKFPPRHLLPTILPDIYPRTFPQGNSPEHFPLVHLSTVPSINIDEKISVIFLTDFILVIVTVIVNGFLF